MSCFDSQIIRLQSRRRRFLSSFSMVAERLGRLTIKKRLCPKLSRRFSGPALPGRMLSQKSQAVDEVKPDSFKGFG
jgi:hypothetical protein